MIVAYIMYILEMMVPDSGPCKCLRMLHWVNTLSRLTVTAMLCAVLRKRDKYFM